jgi:DNA-binding NarL/FixJ family response regulator
VIDQRGVEQQPLTARQVRVLALVAEGLTNRQIADRLGVTPQTVGLHLSRTYRVIGVANRTAAARWAARAGVVGAPTE